MRIGPGWPVIVLLCSVSLCSAQQPSDFSGTWVLKLSGQAILKLTLATDKGSFTGSLTKPRQLTFDQDGDVEKISPGEVTLPVQKAAFNGRQLELTVDDDHFVLTMEDPNRVLLILEEVFRWHLERAPEGEDVILASRLPERDFPDEIRVLREQSRSMVTEDQDARMAFDQARMEAV